MTASSTDGSFAVPAQSPRLPGPVRRGDRDAGPLSPARAGERPRRRGCEATKPRARETGDRGQSQTRAKSVICLFQHGGPSQMDLFDPKPVLTKHHGKPYPGTLEIHFDKQAGNLLASPVPVPAAWPVGNGAQRARSAHVPDRRRPDPGALDDDRVGRPRVGAAADPHRQGPGRPADVGLVGRLRAGDREPEPAGLRGLVRPRRVAGRRRSQLVERLAAGDLSGNAVPLGRCAGAQPEDAARRHGRGP